MQREGGPRREGGEQPADGRAPVQCDEFRLPPVAGSIDEQETIAWTDPGGTDMADLVTREFGTRPGFRLLDTVCEKRP